MSVTSENHVSLKQHVVKKILVMTILAHPQDHFTAEVPLMKHRRRVQFHALLDHLKYVPRMKPVLQIPPARTRGPSFVELLGKMRQSPAQSLAKLMMTAKLEHVSVTQLVRRKKHFIVVSPSMMLP